MSRIIVKQLPKKITTEKVRSLFETKGHITDIQFKYTADGKFRQFCFIGYHNENEAQAAVDYFNNSCIQTSRIKVELCAALSAEDKPLPWSKHSKDNIKAVKAKEKAEKLERAAKKATEHEQKLKVTKIDAIIGEHKNDPEFIEFMKVHDRNRTLWANDFVDNTGINENENNKNQEINDAVAVDENAKDKDINDADDDDDDNDDVGDDVGDVGDVGDDDADDAEKLAEKPISDLEYMKSLMRKQKTNQTKEKIKLTKVTTKKSEEKLDLFTIKIHNVPYNIKRQDIIKFFKPIKPYSVRLPTKVHGFCYVGFKTEKDMTKAMFKHKSFIKGTQVFFSDFTEKNKISKAKIINNKQHTTIINPKWSKQEESIKNEESIAESGRIFFRNLSHTIVEDDLQKLFEKFGPIAELSLPVDALTRKMKGFGTVTFVMPEHAVLAFNKLDGIDFHGRLLHLIPGKSRNNVEQLNENDATLTFKQKKQLKLKKNAQQSSNWNTLFMGQNAIAEILAKQYETTKEKILDTNQGGSSAAVRMALGETQIVIEMKKFLEENGVNLKAFDTPTTKRSKTIILSKNLPAETTIAELIPIFSKFGPIVRLILPPTGVTALIEYSEAIEARKAFKKLAYSKFKHLPLYLEWAPENVFESTNESKTPIIPKDTQQQQQQTENDDKTKQVKSKENEIVQSESESETNKNSAADDINKNEAQDDDNDDDDDDDDEPEPNTTLFLRNLNFKTIKDTVYEHFKHFGSINTVEIAKRKDPDNPRNLISLGYGFIQFKKTAIAQKVLKDMQMTVIDGNTVELKRSDRTLRSAENTQRKKRLLNKQNGTKILVRNIPFQAKTKEVRDIFQAFGLLRSIRLPKKLAPGESNTHRGFGFVDYITKSDAKSAFDALCESTHLYGRRLVLEWAAKDNDDDLDELRKRAAIDYYGNAKDAKRSKKSVFDTEGAIAEINEADNDN